MNERNRCRTCGYSTRSLAHFDVCVERDPQRKPCRLCGLVLTANPDGVCTFRSEAEDRMLAAEHRRSA